MKRSRCSRADSRKNILANVALAFVAATCVWTLWSHLGREEVATLAERFAALDTAPTMAAPTQTPASASTHIKAKDHKELRCAVRRAAFPFHARHTLRRRALFTRRPPWSADQPKHAEVAGRGPAVVRVRNAGRAEIAAAGGASIEIACLPAADASSVRTDHARTDAEGRPCRGQGHGAGLDLVQQELAVPEAVRQAEG